MSRSRILIVDDEQAMLHATRRVLSESYEVETASSAGRALDLLPAFKPDLAILDIRMPEMDGFELMAKLKQQRPELDVIVMTGSVSEADAKLIRAIREKAFYFIQKPFDREVLLTLVARCLELRRMTDSNRRHLARLEGELREARAFQQSLLPAAEAKVEGVAICARYVPCNELGGDFFDYVAAGEGRTTVLVADVSGHGAAAAMLTGIVKVAFHSAAPDDYDPLAVIERIAHGMRTLADNMMVTAICARISSRARTLEYACAGHPVGILWSPAPGPSRGTAPGVRGAAGPDARASSDASRTSGSSTERPGLVVIHQLVPTGPLISPALPSVRWQKKTLPLEGPARLLLYSDGIVEAQGEDGEFGLTRLLGLIGMDDIGGREPSNTRPSAKASHPEGRDATAGAAPGATRGPQPPTEGLPDRILDALQAFAGGRPTSDDMTLLEARID